MSATAGEERDGDNQEWTRIVRKGHSKKLAGRKQQQQKQQDSPNPPAAGPVENFRPNAAPLLSVDDIHAQHHKVAAKWRETETYAQLRELVKANADVCVRIRRAVCLGLGAFDPEDGSWTARTRSHVQLAAFLTMVKALEGDNENIECFYQEPRFAQPDKDFLKTLGGKVVESPNSYELVDENTLVFGVHLYRDIWAAALEKSLPGMFVGTGWDVWDQSPDAEKSKDFDRIRQMDTGPFSKLAFPQDDHSSFSSTCVYWKKRYD